jgi:hypothetical protein
VGVVHNATEAMVTAAVTAAMTNAGMGASGYTLTLTPSDPMSLAGGEPLRVEISVPYAGIGMNFPLVPVPANLRASVTLAREGP